MRRIPLFLSLLSFALLAWATTAHASAGPQPTSSSPAAGEHLDEAPAEVSITFNEPLDASSVMKVTDECGRRIDDRGVVVSLMEMSVGIAETPSGMYKVVYAAQGIGGVTGTTVGEFEFMVMSGEACSASSGGHDHGGPPDNGHSGNHRNGEDHGTDHNAMNHDQGTHEGSGHTAGGGGHENHGQGSETVPDPDAPLAASAPVQPAPNAVAPLAAPTLPEASTDAVLTALAIALAVGVLGGWLLRKLPATN